MLARDAEAEAAAAAGLPPPAPAAAAALLEHLVQQVQQVQQQQQQGAGEAPAPPHLAQQQQQQEQQEEEEGSDEEGGDDDDGDQECGSSGFLRSVKLAEGLESLGFSAEGLTRPKDFSAGEHRAAVLPAARGEGEGLLSDCTQQSLTSSDTVLV